MTGKTCYIVWLLCVWLRRQTHSPILLWFPLCVASFLSLSSEPEHLPLRAAVAMEKAALAPLTGSVPMSGRANTQPELFHQAADSCMFLSLPCSMLMSLWAQQLPHSSAPRLQHILSTGSHSMFSVPVSDLSGGVWSGLQQCQRWIRCHRWHLLLLRVLSHWHRWEETSRPCSLKCVGPQTLWETL